MNQKDLRIFLILQIAGFVVAGSVFSIFESRLMAGGIAGFFFLASGFYMVWRAWQWRDKWRSLVIYPLLLHVFGISLPMVAVRFYQYQTNFTDIKIWGLPGPVFHQFSSTLFTVLFAVTIVDLIRTRRKPLV